MHIGFAWQDPKDTSLIHIVNDHNHNGTWNLSADYIHTSKIKWDAMVNVPTSDIEKLVEKAVKENPKILYTGRVWKNNQSEYNITGFIGPINTWEFFDLDGWVYYNSTDELLKMIDDADNCQSTNQTGYSLTTTYDNCAD